MGTLYSQTLTATGGASITWSLNTDSDPLPGGLTLSSGGLISGTPTAEGGFHFTVKAENARGSDTQALSIIISPVSTGGGDDDRDDNSDPSPSGRTLPSILGISATPHGSNGAWLEVAAMGADGPFTYQWQVKGSWIDIPGATSARFDYSGLASNTAYTVRVKVTNAAGNTAISPEITFTTGAVAITGLPVSYALVQGQSVCFSPFPAGGSWSYDDVFLSMKKNGDKATFTARKPGKTTVKYTVGGTEYIVSVTISSSTIPQTGDTARPLPYILLGLSALLGALLYRRKRGHA